MLEELADEFERRGQRERAFDCYGILLRLGRDTGSFENVAEGYLNAIRLLAADDQKFYVLQYYEDFLAYAVQSREWQAAATLAREAAEYCAKVGLLYERHYRQRAATLFAEAARHTMAAGGPSEMAENALVSAIDVSAAMGDLAFCAELYASAAELPLAPKRKERYAALAARFRAKGERAAPGPVLPGLPAAHRRLPGRLAPGHRRVGARRPARYRCWPTWWSSGSTTPPSPGRRCGRCSTVSTRTCPWTNPGRPPIWPTPWARCRCTRCCGRSSTWPCTGRGACGRG